MSDGKYSVENLGVEAVVLAVLIILAVLVVLAVFTYGQSKLS